MDVSLVAQGVAWTDPVASLPNSARAARTAASAAGQAGTDPWREVGQAYDVRSMTLEDMDAATLDLYQAGEITLFDRALLTFDPGRLAVNGQPEADNAGWLTPADGEGKRDWVAEWDARLAQDEKLGQDRNAANDRRILDILHRLEAGAAPGLDRMA